MIWLIGNKGMLGTDIENDLRTNNIEFIVSDREVDITDYKAIKTFAKDKNVDWIINCSAYTAVDKAEDETELCYKINAEGVLNIAKLALELDAKLIHISTDYVFDGTKKEEYHESDKTNPISVYGKSKLLGEKNITDTMKKYFIIRTAWLYGKNGNNFPFTMIRLFKEREIVKVVNDQFGSPTYTKDLSKCILKIISSNSTDFSIYHFTNEGKTTWFEFANKIFSMALKENILTKDIQILPIKTEEYPTKATRPQNSHLSKEKIKKTFSISVRNWEEALTDFIKEIK
jgi:dTDP-4-dehydrorhamnose reductase